MFKIYYMLLRISKSIFEKKMKWIKRDLWASTYWRSRYFCDPAAAHDTVILRTVYGHDDDVCTSRAEQDKAEMHYPNPNPKTDLQSRR